MIPPSQPATNRLPKRGEMATTRPARISTPPTMYMASWALPGMMSLNSLARYMGQLSFITSTNLSSPIRIGRATNPIRRTVKAWLTGSLRNRFHVGNGIGRKRPAIALIGLLLSAGQGTAVWTWAPALGALVASDGYLLSD